MRPPRILVIEDDRAIAELTSIWMRDAGYDVRTAFDGESGLEAARLERPDLVLLDVRMPGIDGFEVQRRMREDPELQAPCVVFLSAHVQEDARRQAAANGACAFLSKPYESEDVVNMVARALGDRTARFVEGDHHARWRTEDHSDCG